MAGYVASLAPWKYTLPSFLSMEPGVDLPEMAGFTKVPA